MNVSGLLARRSTLAAFAQTHKRLLLHTSSRVPAPTQISRQSPRTRDEPKSRNVLKQVREASGNAQRFKKLLFSRLGLDHKLVAAATELLGLRQASYMQAQLVQALTDAQNHVVVRQETGSGKSIAVLLSVLSMAIRDYEQVGSFETLMCNTVIVVPNPVLAMQLEEWARVLIERAYPDLPAVRLVQGFDIERIEEQRARVVEHGPPVIAIGQPRELVELFGDPSVPLSVRVPKLMRGLVRDVQRVESNDEWVQKMMRATSKGAKKKGLDNSKQSDYYVGLRRLVIEEVDTLLDLPNRRRPHGIESRRRKPRYGRVLVDAILEVCGVTPVLARSLLVREKLNPAYVKALPVETDAEMLEMSGSDELMTSRDHQRLAAVFRRAVEKAINRNSSMQKADHHTLGQQHRSKRKAFVDTDAIVERSAKMRALDDPLCSTVTGESLQLVVMSATLNKPEREWMKLHGWMPGHEVRLDARMAVPGNITHHCLVIEDQSRVRNLRLKSEAQKKNVESEWREEEQPQAELFQMAEAAANIIRELQPTRAIVFSPHVDKLVYVLGTHGINATSIKNSRQKMAQAPVYVANEALARGVDVADALVVILGAPQTPDQYAQMAGRSGRFGRAGTVVTVVPMGGESYL
ncbi:P-loop containing nucleoside triphosphate hydrolase protein [Coemansia spiralis]|nr:P-loop containing nucleoside triphosphate hydrolase protein [Coemansia spiralis]